MNITPRVVTALALAGTFACSSLSAAESGPYIRLENGVNSISGADLHLDSTTVSTLRALGYDAKGSTQIKFKSGYIYGGAIGYRFGESFSTEIELDHSESKVETISGYSVQNTVLGVLGQSNVAFNQTSLLISGIYNHRLSESVTLNLGAGAGAQFCSANLQEVSFTQTVGGVAYTLSGKRNSDAAFLAQIKTGVSVAVAKNLTFDAGYKMRFVGSTDIYEASIRSTPLNGSEKFTVDTRLNHVFSAGFTYSF